MYNSAEKSDGERGKGKGWVWQGEGRSSSGGGRVGREESLWEWAVKCYCIVVPGWWQWWCG